MPGYPVLSIKPVRDSVSCFLTLFYLPAWNTTPKKPVLRKSLFRFRAQNNLSTSLFFRDRLVDSQKRMSYPLRFGAIQFLVARKERGPWLRGRLLGRRRSNFKIKFINSSANLTLAVLTPFFRFCRTGWTFLVTLWPFWRPTTISWTTAIFFLDRLWTWSSWIWEALFFLYRINNLIWFFWIVIFRKNIFPSCWLRSFFRNLDSFDTKNGWENGLREVRITFLWFAWNQQMNEHWKSNKRQKLLLRKR